MFKSKHNFHLNKSILILKVNVAHFKLIDERSWSIPHNHNIPGLIPARDPWYMSTSLDTVCYQIKKTEIELNIY